MLVSNRADHYGFDAGQVVAIVDLGGEVVHGLALVVEQDPVGFDGLACDANVGGEPDDVVHGAEFFVELLVFDVSVC